LNWRDILVSDPTDWLLGEDYPSVQFFTLTHILEKPLKKREVIQSRQDIMKSGVVPKILDKQKEGGYWESQQVDHIERSQNN
jgi:hypothetical protein